MGDLDDWLLEAAGRTSAQGTTKKKQKPSRRRRQGSYSDDDSSSKDESDDDKHLSRKPSGSHVPLKKRAKKIGDDYQESLGEEGDHDSDDSGVGSDLYKDEDDRQQLAQMTELERELILSDRASKKDDKKLHKQMISRWNKDKKGEHTPRSVRTSARSTDKSAAKADALNELRARRMKRDPEGRNSSGDPSKVAPGSSRGYSPIKRRGFGGSSPRSSCQSESHSDDEGSVGDDSDDERLRSERDTIKFEDIQSITIRRSKLVKWFMEPFFEELIVGCLVRVGIGERSGQNIYRLCIVQNVDSSEPNRAYQLENKSTHKYLNCVWGSESSAARWQMARISDSPPSKEEFEQWAREVERSGGWMPTRKDVKDKSEAIDKANSFVYSAETVKQMLEKKASSRPLNVAAEREKLRREMEKATENEDETEVERIKERVEELEEVRRSSQKKNLKALKLQEMNRKNRVDNFKTASGSKPMNPNLKIGEAGYDPFSRRWTRSQSYYAGKPETGEDNAATGNGAVALAEAEAEADKLIDTSAPVDLGTNSNNTLHGFELPISLALLQRFGGPHGAESAFIARKQRIEAKVGRRVQEDDTYKRHVLTLTVGDYTRRRGLA